MSGLCGIAAVALRLVLQEKSATWNICGHCLAYTKASGEDPKGEVLHLLLSSLCLWVPHLSSAHFHPSIIGRQRIPKLLVGVEISVHSLGSPNRLKQ